MSLGGRGTPHWAGTKRPYALAILVAAVVLGGLAVLGSRGTAQSRDDCDARDDYPFEHISCSLFQAESNRIAAAAVESHPEVAISASDAERAALAHRPGATVIETALVRVWSAESDNPERDARLAWAVSLDLPNGVFISGGAFHLKALREVKGDAINEPLTEEEAALVQEKIREEMEALRASIAEEYHVAFVDPVSGEWVGAVEGAARGR